MYVLIQNKESLDNHNYYGVTPLAISDSITKLMKYDSTLEWSEPSYDETDLDSFCIVSEDKTIKVPYNDDIIKVWHSIENAKFI